MQKSTPNAEAIVALMGATGTGKSTFINLLTNDDAIHIGHDLDSKTIDVNTSRYDDAKAGLRVTLVDTPGFDDSREGVTDTDILGKIAKFLQDDGRRKLNGIIYLHRISDPRLGGTARKNLRVFREICGDDNLGHVRIVTTYWNRVSEKEGNDREAALANGPFKSLIDAGAKLIRHDNGRESARLILSELVSKAPVLMKLQEELNAGRALGDTSAGAIIVEEMKELQEKHENEMADLKKEMEDAANEELRAELDEERQKLKARMMRVQEDRKRLAMMRMDSETRPPLDRGAQARDNMNWEYERRRDEEATRAAVSQAIEAERNRPYRKKMMEAAPADEIPFVPNLITKFMLYAIGLFLDVVTARIFENVNREHEGRRDEEVTRVAVNQAIVAERNRPYRKMMIEAAEEIPFVPTFIAKVVLYAIGLFLDIVTGRIFKVINWEHERQRGKDARTRRVAVNQATEAERNGPYRKKMMEAAGKLPFLPIFIAKFVLYTVGLFLDVVTGRIFE